jgi:hypothetical protein
MADSARISFQTASTHIQPEEGNKEDASIIAFDTKSNPDPYLVLFDEGDPANPKVLSSRCKTTMLMSSPTRLELVLCKKVVPHPRCRSPGPQCVRMTSLAKYQTLMLVCSPYLAPSQAVLQLL